MGQVREPASTRIPISFLSALKKLLVGWDMRKEAININESDSSMEISGIRVLETSAKDGALQMKWCSKE